MAHAGGNDLMNVVMGFLQNDAVRSGDAQTMSALSSLLDQHADLIQAIMPHGIDLEKTRYSLREWPHVLEENKQGERNVQKDFLGTFVGFGEECIASFPGKYGRAWNYMTTIADHSVRTTCVFLPPGGQYTGCASPCLCAVPEDEGGLGGKAQDGCRWWAQWLENVQEAKENEAEFLVFHWCGWKPSDGPLAMLGKAQTTEVKYLLSQKINLNHKSMDEFRDFCMKHYMNKEMRDTFEAS